MDITNPVEQSLQTNHQKLQSAVTLLPVISLHKFRTRTATINAILKIVSLKSWNANKFDFYQFQNFVMVKAI